MKQTGNRLSKWVVLAGLCLAALLLWHTPAAQALTDAEFTELQNAPAPTTAGANGAATEAAAPQAPSLPKMISKLAVALGVVFGLMALILWGGKKFFPRSPLGGRGGAIEIIATRTLGQRRSLMLVRAQGKTMLLGATPQQINFLTEFDEGGDWNAATETAARNAGLDPVAMNTGAAHNSAGTTLMGREG